LPNFIGSPFPRRDDPEIHDFYCAAMLVLLKPWRDLQADLKDPGESWIQAFDTFAETANERVRDILAGIQYFHSCRSAALASYDANNNEVSQPVENPQESEDLGEDVE
ncbi:hypothetical protein DFH08DRAFT_649678, partial [Mycena albidolilacea]